MSRKRRLSTTKRNRRSREQWRDGLFSEDRLWDLPDADDLWPLSYDEILDEEWDEDEDEPDENGEYLPLLEYN
jgi:hypothetical protein